MQNKRDVEWTWSGAFWLKKLLQLAGLILLGWLIWWLWQGFDGDVDLNTDGTDGTAAVVQQEADDDVDADVSPTAAPTPDTSNSFGYTVDAVDANLQAIDPRVEGCLHTYALEDNVSMIIADSCDDLRDFANDFTWNHDSDANGSTVTAKETSYCPAPSDDCSVRNGILEFSSWSNATEGNYVDVRIVSTNPSDEITNVQSQYGEVISSIKVQR